MKGLSRLYTWPLAFLATAIVLSAPVQAAGDHKGSVCQVSQLDAHFDDRDGVFDGMSQRGTLLVLRNNGPHTCQLGALPTLRFEGPDGQRLPVERRLPRGMHPGPVLLPVAVAPGVEVAMLLHWVSGDVYPGHNCLTPATAVLDLSEEALRVPFGLPMCAAVGSAEFFDQAPLGRVTDKVE
ncbi:DUF4232 domain-containing protein [Pseudomonas fluorescens]|nr:DUF4232 domain-containing protein [Pseudomonas fluorescens]